MPGVKTKVPAQGGKESWRTGRWSGQKEPETSTRVWRSRQQCLHCCTAQTEAGCLPRTRPGSGSPAGGWRGDPEDEAHGPGFKAQLDPELGHRCPSASISV